MNIELILLILSGAVFAAALFVVPAVRNRIKRKRAIIAGFGAVSNNRLRDLTIPALWERYAERYPSPLHVDDLTWSDLEMDEVFERVDRCQSSIGQNWLYLLLRRADADGTAAERLVRHMAALEDADLRVAVQMQLSALGKNQGHGVETLVFEPEVFQLPHAWRYPVQAALPLLTIPVFFLSVPVAALCLAACLMLNIVTFLQTKRRTDSPLNTVAYFLRLLRYAKKLRKLLDDRCPDSAAEFGAALEPFQSVERASGMLFSSNSDAMMLADLIGMLTLIPAVQYCRTIRLIGKKTDGMLRLIELVGELDAAASTLSFRSSLPVYAVPEFSETLQVTAAGLYHPLIDAAVPYDVATEKNMLLTGSNASGKSTFIKAIAVNILLAEKLNTCCAAHFCVKRLPVISSMAVTDSTVDGESYYIAEIKSMRRILRLVDAGQECYIFIDEILKGTNTVERISASAAVLGYLAEKRCFCAAATHDIELTAMMADRYDNVHFSEQITDSGVAFDYLLRPGPSRTRNAIKLLEHYGFPAAVITDANKNVAALEARHMDQRTEK